MKLHKLIRSEMAKKELDPAVRNSDLTYSAPLNKHRPSCAQTLSGCTCKLLDKVLVQPLDMYCKGEKKIYRNREARKRTPETSRFHIKSPYCETSSLHSALTTPLAPIALLISVTTV